MTEISSVRRHVGILVLLGSVLFLWRLGSHDLWPPDEPRFAMQAWEMRVRGDYHLPTLNGVVNVQKEPLFMWAIDAFALLRGGVDEWAARLPSAVAAIATLLLVYGLGASLYDRRTGFYGALVFGTSEQILDQGRVASIDMLLTMLSLAATVLLWRASTRPSNRWETMAAWACMALATLAKGPVGLVAPLMAVGPALLLLWDWAAIRRLLRVSGIVVYLLITLSWYVPFALRIGWERVRYGVYFNNVARYLDASNFGHPVWYYLWLLPVGFLPWIFFLPAAIRDAFRDPETGDRRRSAVFLVSWFATTFVFFSIASGKRGVYILSLYPAIALLVGSLFARASAAPEESFPRRRFLVPGTIWVALTAFLFAALPLAAWYHYPEATVAATSAGTLLLAGAIAAVVFLRKRRARPAFASLAGSMALLLLLLVEFLFPVVNERQNIRGFADQVAAEVSPDIPLATTKMKRDAWVFYLGRLVTEVEGPEQVREYLAGPGPRDLIAEQDALDQTGEELPSGWRTLLSDEVGGHDFHLLRRQAQPVPAEVSASNSPYRGEKAAPPEMARGSGAMLE